MHHLDGTASKTEGHGPQRTLASPVGDLIESGPNPYISYLAHCATSNPYFNAHSIAMTYSAYCMAPFFPSWLGRGTSRRAAFIGGGVPEFPGIVAGVFIVVALSEELDERKAADPARNGTSAVEGLAV